MIFARAHLLQSAPFIFYERKDSGPQMIPCVRDFLGLMEEIAPVELAEPWDNPGLQVGSHSQKIRKMFVALDATLKSIQSARRHEAQLLFTHHPLIFKALSRVDVEKHPGNVVVEALKSGISIVAAHTNLDVAKEGINHILAELLGLRHVEVLQETADSGGAGLGRVGELAEKGELSEVVRRLSGILGVKRFKVVGREDMRIGRVAVVGGSGGHLLSLASEKRADLLITGDVGYHHALEAESLGIALIDGGHFNTEKTAFSAFTDRLKDLFKERGWDVSVEVAGDEVDPMYYT